MTAILGISAWYHDSAAALVVDGEIVAAAQEERFTRVKHDPRFPQSAIAYCLREAGLRPDQLDLVGFYDKPLLKFDRLLETYLAFAPAGFRSFARAMPQWLREKLHLPREMRRHLPGYARRFVFPLHHESHAASAFFPSPFQHAAILTCDGVGEWSTATIGEGRDNRITLLKELRFPHSPGLLYSAFTSYCGFRVNSGEYKLMGLAPYGSPRFLDRILDRLIDLKADGSFRMDMRYFRYAYGLRMANRRFDALFGRPPRKPEAPLDEFHMDVAASIQAAIEEIVLRMARHARDLTGLKHLCMAGGVALNCVANGKLLRDGTFDDIWIQPAAGDAGGALGVAQLIWHQLLDKPRTAVPGDSQRGSLLGPSFSESEIRAFLVSCDAVFTHEPDDAALCEAVAKELADGRVVGWFEGRMEFGPRALGARSILGDARNREMQSRMNLKTKFRESFRPFAPVVLKERAHEWFDVPAGTDSPYMLLVAPLKPSRRLPVDARVTGLDRLWQVRSEVPAITHVDCSARLQTADAARHGRYYRLLQAFEKLTGCPLCINTSFNVRGEPIVCTPEDAWRVFMHTNMDVLVLERFILHKPDQPGATEHDVDAHLARFELD
ncbi:MAG: carbamoyltransferase [Planctomycetota bacterium]